MRVLVTGGRDYADRRFLTMVMNRIAAKRPIATVIEGGARGADRLARGWALKAGIEVVTFDADWELYGNRAGPVRNCKMLREGRPDLVVAFQGGTGTAHMIRIAKEAGVPVIESWKYKESPRPAPPV